MQQLLVSLTWLDQALNVLPIIPSQLSCTLYLHLVNPFYWKVDWSGSEKFTSYWSIDMYIWKPGYRYSFSRWWCGWWLVQSVQEKQNKVNYSDKNASLCGSDGRNRSWETTKQENTMTSAKHGRGPCSNLSLADEGIVPCLFLASQGPVESA